MVAGEQLDNTMIDEERLRQIRDYATLELQGISDALWMATGYDKDPLIAAQEAFPLPDRRRSDSEFSCDPDDEPTLRRRAEELGPGRAKAESLKDLGVERVDAEIIEPGQLHKTVTELWQALQSGQSAPIVIFASDRQIPLWVRGKENEEVDSERMSSVRLLTVGGRDLTSPQFFLRAGRFDERAKDSQEDLKAQALALSPTEFEITEQFLGTIFDEEAQELNVGYNPESGQLIPSATGQVRKFGSIEGRDVILVHKKDRQSGDNFDPTDTMLIVGALTSVITEKQDITASYYTSSTYKPSRLMSGLSATLAAAKHGSSYKVVVPNYGYEDLGAIKGDQNPKPQTINQIATELGKAAEQAIRLRETLSS